MAAVLIVGAIGVPVGCTGSAAPAPEAAATAPQSAAPSVYRDKNGYFTFLVPDAWTRRDYPDDPRSKVEFSHPSAPGVRVRLIAALAPPHMTTANFITLMRQDLETMKSRLGAVLRRIELQEKPFAGFPGAAIQTSTPDGDQELTVFLAGNLFFNVSFEAPDAKALATHRPTLDKSLETLIVKNPTGPTGPAIQAQRVARYLRIAVLAAEAGQFDVARGAVEDGLVEYPKDESLLKALEAVKAKKIPR